MKTVVLLHGAIGASDQMQKIKSELSSDYQVLDFNFPGHGGQPRSGLLTMESCRDSLDAWMTENGISGTNFFGYSMGGYVALMLALNQPHKVEKVITLGTKFAWTPDIALKESRMLDPQVIAEKVPAFAAALEKRHMPNDWRTLLSDTAAMLQQLGANPPLNADTLTSITHEVLILLGERDNMVSREESLEAAQQLKNGMYSIVDDTPHPIEKVAADQIARIVRNFIQ